MSLWSAECTLQAFLLEREEENMKIEVYECGLREGAQAKGISYTVDGLTVTGTEYSAALDRQAQKPEAVWYEWNETNLNLLFGSVTARSNGES